MPIKITSPVDQIDSAYTPAFEFGTRATDRFGNEYIYLKGTTSVEQYDACRFNTSTGSVVRLLTAAAVSAGIGIAQAAITSNSAGWFQTFGTGWIQCAATTSDGSSLFAGGTAGCVTGVITAGDPIMNMLAIGAGTGAAGGTIKVRLLYPHLYVMKGVL